MIRFLDILALILATSGFGAEFRVSNDSELKKAAASAEPGDSIVLLTKGDWSDARIELEFSGITLKAEHQSETAFTGQSSLEIIGEDNTIDGLTFTNGYLESGHVLSIRGARNRVTRCSIIDYNPPEPSTRYHWLSLYGKHHRVDHCRFSGQNHSGTTICVWLNGEGAGHHRIDHNHIGPRTPGDSNGFEAIRIGTSEVSTQNANCMVTKNLFEGCDGEAEIISNKSCENTYLANTFVRCAGSLTLRHGNRCLVAHNIILGEGKKGTGGIRVMGEDHVVRHNHIEGTDGRANGAISISAGVPDSELHQYFQVKNLLVEENTLFNNRSGNFAISSGKGSRGRTLDPVNLTIRNNLEEAADWRLRGHRLTPHDVGPETIILPHPDALPGTHAVGEVDNLDLTAWIIPSPQSIPGIVLDETNAKLEGEWQYSTHTPPYVGIGYLHDRKDGKGEKSMTWEFHPPESGRYRVEVSHCYNIRRATNTPVTVTHADGEETFHINQQEMVPGRKLFRPLGEFRFEKNQPGLVRISNEGTDPTKVVIADAVRLVPLKKAGL